MTIESRSNYSSDINTLLMVGGGGTRLEAITDGKLSKGRVPINHEGTVSGVDYISDLLRQLDIHNVYLCVRHFADQYTGLAQEKSYGIIYQKGETGTSGGLEDAIEEYGLDKQYLLIATDTFFSKRDLVKLLREHKPGTISWGVSRHQFDAMSSYGGLIVDDETNAILGDTTLPWWENGDLTGISSYVKVAVNVIDPKVYTRALKQFKRLCKKPYPLDIHWDVIPMLEEQNRRRLLRGQNSILQAIIFDDPVVDFGTPERLQLTRELFDDMIKRNESFQLR